MVDTFRNGGFSVIRIRAMVKSNFRFFVTFYSPDQMSPENMRFVNINDSTIQFFDLGHLRRTLPPMQLLHANASCNTSSLRYDILAACSNPLYRDNATQLSSFVEMLISDNYDATFEYLIVETAWGVVALQYYNGQT